ncbi:MAG: DUF3801 domain-containing protein [Gracilibacteraceae bacterium]|jgi:hypothetical protein|nr:DUF3801 domain-containing protein [Gracilibacteraceae bacterium]
MNHSGDAAEQIVRMSLEGVEVAARITGTAAKEIALLLMAALKSPEKSGLKSRGKARLESMLKSGKALEIFSVRERDLRTFAREAKNYGIVYCVLRDSKNTPDGLCDIMVKADDAPKINRLVERFKFAAVDKAKIESEIVRDMAAKTAEVLAEPAAPEGAQPGEPDIDRLLDELLGADGGKTAPEKSEAEKAAGRPTPGKSRRKARKEPAPPDRGNDSAPRADARNDPAPLAGGGSPSADSQDRPSPKTNPSALSSANRKNSERAMPSKPSVKEELREIAAARKAEEAAARRREEPVMAGPKETQAPAHTQPKSKRKSPKSKGR